MTKAGVYVKHNPFMPLVGKGLERQGLSVIYTENPRDLASCDFATFWSMKKEQARVFCEKNKIPYLVTELGFLGKRNENLSVGWGGINGEADFCHPEFLTRGENWEHLLKPWKDSGRYILLLGQTAGDHTLRNIPMRLKNLYPHLAKKLMETYNLPVKFRPHPKWECPTPEWLQKTPKGNTLEEDLEKAWLAVAWSSNSLVEAVCSGTPILCFDKISMAYEMGRHEIGDIPLRPDRGKWIYKLAHSQWTRSEIESGVFWEQLQKGIEK